MDSGDILSQNYDENLNITVPDLDFDDIGELIEEFRAHPLVHDALHNIKAANFRHQSEKLEADLRRLETHSLGDYVNEVENFLALHSGMQKCDSLLATMSKTLRGFEEDLMTLSFNIETLLDESLKMNTQLKNIKEVTSELKQFVNAVVMDENFVSAICDGEITEEYMDYVEALYIKEATIDEYARTHGEQVRAAVELQPVLHKLRVKALMRIRSFLLSKILSLQKPNTNIQIIQQNVLIKYHHFFKFVNQFKDIAMEIIEKYLETVGPIFFTNFKNYIANLTKLKYEHGKPEFLGSPEDVTKHKGGPCGPFALSNRNVIFQKRTENGSIIPHIAFEQQQKFSLEQIFQSLHLLLVDTVSSELKFEKAFFGTYNFFSPLFSKIIDMYLDWLDLNLKDFWDAIGVLLMMNVIEQCKETMRSRDLPDLDPYLAHVKFKLSTRLSQILEANIQSLNEAKPSRGSPEEFHPHPIMRKYSELVFAVATLEEKLDPQDRTKIASKMVLLRKAMVELLVTRLAPVDKPPPNQLKQSVFFINNYHIVVSLFQEKNMHEKEEAKQFQDLKKFQISRFIEDELFLYFNSLVIFIKQTTLLGLEDTIRNSGKINTTTLPTQATSALPSYKLDQDLIISVVKEFALTWKQNLKRIHHDIMITYFSDFRLGSEILKKVFTQLLLYYKRFEEIIKKYDKVLYDKLVQDIVPVPTMTYEMKQYNIDFS